MKILVVANLYYPYVIGGGEISTKLLCEGLQMRGHDVTVLSSSAENKTELINGILVTRFPNNIYWSYNKEKQSIVSKVVWHLYDEYNFKVERYLKVFFRQSYYDVVITSTLDGFSGIVWKMASKKGFKVIHILRSYSLACLRASLFKENQECRNRCLECKLTSLMKKSFSNKYVDVVIGISNYILERHIQLGYFKNVNREVIYNPVRIPKGFRDKDGKKVRIGFVGSIQEKKGIALLMKAFTELHEPGVGLHIFGSPIQEKYLKSLCQKYPDRRIHFEGYQDSSTIYSSIDFLVVPSLWPEPFGRIIVESYSYGVPVVCSNRGGMPELVEEGVTGFIFDPLLDKDLNNKLRMMINNKLYIKFQADCLKAAEKFAEEEIMNEYDGLLNKL